MKKPILALTLVTYGFMVVEAAAQRSFAAGNSFLNLDGVLAGALIGVEGGAVTADVIESPATGAQAAQKQLGPLRYENFKVQVGLAGMDGAMYKWISQSWSQDYSRQNGAIIAADYRLEARIRKEFFNAVITETTLPACDASSKVPGFIKVGFAPEYTRSAKASGKVTGNSGTAEQKRWLAGDFRLTIDGLDCTRVTRIESFTVKRTLAKGNAGETHDYFGEPGKIDFPNLKVTLSAASAQTWQEWFQDFVVGGNNLAGGEKHGTLEFLSPNHKDVLATLEFDGLGIFRLEEAQDASETPNRITADLYCEKMAFLPGNTVL